MDRDTRNSAIAALVILVLFFAFAYYLPAIMLTVGKVSSLLAVIVAAVFMFVLFVVFWLRGRSQRGKGK
jgi:preprotein translocase subunit YajC